MSHSKKLSHSPTEWFVWNVIFNRRQIGFTPGQILIALEQAVRSLQCCDIERSMEPIFGTMQITQSSSIASKGVWNFSLFHEKVCRRYKRSVGVLFKPGVSQCFGALEPSPCFLSVSFLSAVPFTT